MPVELRRPRSGAAAAVVKAQLAVRTYVWFVAVLVKLKRSPLPEVVARLGAVAPNRIHPLGMSPQKLGWIVFTLLRLRSRRARCLHTALVHFRLLRSQGIDAELVIGLPADADDKDAHAWIEIDGVDVGPPPGKGTHVELVRYG